MAIDFSISRKTIRSSSDMKRVIYKQFISPSNPLESTATTAAKSYVKPPLSVNPAYDHAVKLLQRKTASPALSPIALAYTDFENHFKFNVSKGKKR